jgi:hypothetical protein
MNFKTMPKFIELISKLRQCSSQATNPAKINRFALLLSLSSRKAGFVGLKFSYGKVSKTVFAMQQRIAFKLRRVGAKSREKDSIILIG